MTAAQGEPQAGAPAADPAGQQQTPPWGDDFDAEKAWKLVQNLRDDKAKLASRPAMTDEERKRLGEYDALLEASQSDQERLTGQLSKVQAEAQNWRKTAAASRIEALAAPSFEYPSDAVAKLDPEKYLGSDGQIDEASIKADLAALLTERPSWARQAGGTDAAPGARVPAPNAHQGSGVNGRAAADPRQAFAATLQGLFAGPRSS